MGDLRGLHADAQMRTFGVVEGDYALKLGLALLYAGNFHLVEPFGLDYSIGAFGYRILQGISALGHAYGHIPSFELCHVGRAAILAPSVGMVYELGGRFVVYCGKRHSKRLQGIDGLECRTKGPAHYLMGVSVSY